MTTIEHGGTTVTQTCNFTAGIHQPPPDERDHGTIGRAKFGPAGRDHRNACHCQACRNAIRRSALRRELHGPAYVDATPARQHVQHLLDTGMTRHQIAELAGVNRTSIRHLMVGQANRPPARGLRPDTARALLAVQPGAAQPVDGATCDGTGTRRRLQALMANGWPAQMLAARLLGLDNDTGRSALLQVARRPRVRSSTAIAVSALYDDLADITGPSQWCRTYYRGRGWLPPLWWDDDTIDDPDHQPQSQPRQIIKTGYTGPGRRRLNLAGDVDPVVVERLLAGDSDTPASTAERWAAYQHLRNGGMAHTAAASWLHLSSSAQRLFASTHDDREAGGA